MIIDKAIGYYLISVFNYVILMLSYNKLIKSKFIFNFKNIIVILLGGLIFTLNFYFSEQIYNIFINFLAVYAGAIITSKENISVAFYNILICYLISFVVEIVTSSIVIFASIADMNTFNSNIFLKALITFIDLMLIYYICSLKYVVNIANKISNKAKTNKVIIVVIILSVLFLLISEFKFTITFSNKIYLSNFIMLVCLIVIIICAIKAYLDSETERKKTEALLSFMSKYEKIIDENRTNRHELLNELLILKNISNKKSKEYNDTLDELIDKYTNKGIKIRNIYNLPSGLKGIFYYKLYGLDEKDYDININVSKRISKSFKNISHEDFVSLYRIIGIVLDNAIDASSISLNKYILIDTYEEDNIVIEISNSFKGKVDLNKINDKYYSTKGKNRGLGLYLIKNIINNNKNIELFQSVNNNIFTTKIVINKK